MFWVAWPEPDGWCLQAEGCTADAISAAGHSCGMSGGPKTLHQQHLFSVLTHVGAAEGFKGAPRTLPQTLVAPPKPLLGWTSLAPLPLPQTVHQAHSPGLPM